MSSFDFLRNALLAEPATEAERAIAANLHLSALSSLRAFCELLGKQLANQHGLVIPAELVDLQKLLIQQDILSDRHGRIFDRLRRSGNAAIHSRLGTQQEAIENLEGARTLAQWFHAKYELRGARAEAAPTRAEEKRAAEEPVRREELRRAEQGSSAARRAAQSRGEEERQSRSMFGAGVGMLIASTIGFVAGYYVIAPVLAFLWVIANRFNPGGAAHYDDSKMFFLVATILGFAAFGAFAGWGIGRDAQFQANRWPVWMVPAAWLGMVIAGVVMLHHPSANRRLSTASGTVATQNTSSSVAFGSSLPPEALYRNAQDAWARKDTKHAMQFEEQAAASGDGRALMDLGNIYYSGIQRDGIPVDRQQSADDCKRAPDALRRQAAAGNLQAAGALGRLLFGDGEPCDKRNRKAAYPYLLQAAQGGNRDAMYLMAAILLAPSYHPAYDWPVPDKNDMVTDKEQGCRWFAKSSQAGGPTFTPDYRLRNQVNQAAAACVGRPPYASQQAPQSFLERPHRTRPIPDNLALNPPARAPELSAPATRETERPEQVGHQNALTDYRMIELRGAYWNCVNKHMGNLDRCVASVKNSAGSPPIRDFQVKKQDAKRSQAKWVSVTYLSREPDIYSVCAFTWPRSPTESGDLCPAWVTEFLNAPPPAAAARPTAQGSALRGGSDYQQATPAVIPSPALDTSRKPHLNPSNDFYDWENLKPKATPKPTVTNCPPGHYRQGAFCFPLGGAFRFQ